MDKQAQEAMEVVDTLNETYYNMTDDSTRLPFEFVYVSYWMGIKYFDEIVWDNQDCEADYLVFDDEVDYDQRESILTCVNKRVKAIHDTIRKFKV